MAEKVYHSSGNSKVQQFKCGSPVDDGDVTDTLERHIKRSSLIFTHKTYNMNHPRRGEAIIFNHSCFLTDNAERRGTEADVKNLNKALLLLGFSPEDIHIHHNLTAADISAVLKKVQRKDHTDCDMLMIFVLTHGKHNDKIFAFDVEYPVEALWEPFRADACKSLAEKPKMFFVIACRGQSIDEGLVINPNQSVTEVDAKPILDNYSYSIPVWADFLCVYSTCKGYYSYRNVDDGTWYIQAFCEELSTGNISQVSFTDFLIAVNGRLSRSFGIETPLRRAKQISSFNSTLTKRLYFSNGTPV